MKAQARRAKPRPKPAKRKGPLPDARLVSRIPGYLPRPSRAHPAPGQGDPLSGAVRYTDPDAY